MAKYPTSLLVVAAMIPDRSGRMLLQRRPPDKAHGGLWEFPGGKVEWQESPADALLREIREEIGLTLERKALVPLGFAQSAAESVRPEIVILLYGSEIWSGNPKANEGGELGWFTRSEAQELAMPPLDIELLSRLSGR